MINAHRSFEQSQPLKDAPASVATYPSATRPQHDAAPMDCITPSDPRLTIADIDALFNPPKESPSPMLLVQVAPPQAKTSMRAQMPAPVSPSAPRAGRAFKVKHRQQAQVVQVTYSIQHFAAQEDLICFTPAL